MSKGKQIARRLVKQLRRDLKGIGWGAKKRALEAAGLSRAYLENVKPERIPLGTYFQLLEGVGIEPVAHTRRALTDSEPIQDFIADARNIAAKSGTPPIVRLARKRGAPGMPEDDAGENLEAVDRLRTFDPSAGARRIERLMPRLSGRRTVVRALAAWGSANRTMERYRDAAVAVAECFERCPSSSRTFLQADLADRASCILRQSGRVAWSVHVQALSGGAFLAGGHYEKLPIVLLGLATAGVMSYDYSAVERNAAAALALAPTNRVKAFSLYYRAYGLRARGDLRGAGASLEEAILLGRGEADLVCAASFELAALEARLGRWRNASGLFERSFALSWAWPHLRIKSGIHVIEMLLLLGRPSEAKVPASELREVLGRLGSDPFKVRAPLSRLLERVARGTATRSDVSGVCSRYRKV